MLPEGRCTLSFCLLLAVQDLNPISVGVGNKVQIHFFIFKTDASHLLMQGVGFLFIRHPDSQMNFIVPQVIRLFPIPQPCEFQLVIGCVVGQINNDKRAVRGVDPAAFSQPQRFLIKRKRFFQIEHVEIGM